MESYLNPGNKGFCESLNSTIYVDKSGLIEKPMRFIISDRNFYVSTARRKIYSDLLKM